MEYNNELIGIQNRVITAMIDFSNSMKEIDYTLAEPFNDVDLKYSALVVIAKNAVVDIKKEKPYKKDDKFRKSLEDLLVFYQTIIIKDYKEIVNIIKKGSNITAGDEAMLGSIQKSITERETELDKKLQDAQNVFAAKHGMGLEENRYQKDIDNLTKTTNSADMDEAIVYNDNIVAIQTKVMDAFLDLTDRFSSGDQKEIKKLHDNLMKVTKSSVAEIKKIKPFKGEDEFRKKMQNLLIFYQSIAEKEYREILAVLSKGETATQADWDRISEIQKSITERESVLDREMSQAQKAFSDKFGFRLK